MAVSLFRGVGGELLPYVAGGIGIVSGVGLIVWSALLLKGTGQNPEPWAPTPSIVFDGPYRRSRNPVYVGMLLVVVSVGLVRDNAWGVAMALPAWWLLRHFVVLREESYLARKFGDEYRDYMAKVRRWL